ncbi:MAG: macrophage migration inhibitory factor family protein [uncultured bacterium]|nr:MAG: macrophage migration inhibitory factor family protein [uncultured bacterium]
MPLLKLSTNANIKDEQKNELLKSLSSLLASATGKPEQYVMVVIERADILMSGGGGDSAFVEVKSLGALEPFTVKKLSKKICDLLSASLDISPVRVYINFTDVPANLWAWNGKPFG